MTRVGVVLSGCGFLDGSEIHEATLALYFLDRAGAQTQCLAPKRPQMHVVDHATRKSTHETRDVFTESARIARGRLADIAGAKAADFDALILPGGFGAAKNLCSFAEDGPTAEIDLDVARLLRAMHEARKPIGAICIAPAVLATAFRGGAVHASLTIGDDPATAAALVAMGARHVDRRVDEICIDETNRIVSTPAYMYDERISRVGAGVEKLVAEVLRLAASSS